MNTFEEIDAAIVADPENKVFTSAGVRPLYSVHEEARLLIIGQAPGAKTVDAGIFWKDTSGDRLREWLGISENEFYSTNKLAILPMDFYFPGKGKSGDLPPRKGFAERWHKPLLEKMPEIALTIVIGQYAQAYYLKDKRTTTELVRNFEQFLPRYFPLVHPSPRNNIWMAKNPWFEADVLPELKKRVREVLA
ncbi:MAG: uracil-DNA glycosylase family protein [Streptococcaceae bacterium]|nr:uracil-DNA glycosylase family protein [Streptococcaceae bacterium]